MARAQTDPVVEDSNLEPLSVNGSVGFMAQAYTASGIENRRAPGLAQGTANVNFSVFGLRSGINLLYSTDQSELRQNMNNLSFDARWKWLHVSAGDVSPEFSTFGMKGTTIRGGHLQITPGNFLLELAGGRSQRAVRVSSDRGFREPSFERWTVAGKIGIGRDNSSHFHLGTHYSKDNVNSFEGGNAISPRENLTITPDVKVDFFDGQFSLQSEVTATVYTRDLNSDKLQIDDAVPGFIANLYKPRTSTRVTYAGNTQAELNLDRFGMTAGYERIQPGFRSLGLSRIRDDQERIRFSPTVNFFQNQLNVSANVMLGRDNLLGNRLQTQTTRTVGTTAEASLSDQVMVTASYNLYVSSVESDRNQQDADRSINQQQNSHTLMLQPMITMQSGDRTHNITPTASYTTITNEFSGGGRNDMSSETITATLGYSLTFPTGLSVNATGNYLVNNSNRFSSTTLGMNLGGSYAFFDRSLTVSVNAGINQNRNERSSAGGTNDSGFTNTFRQVTANINAGYRLSSKDTINLSIRNRNNQVVEGTGASYTELEARIQYQRGF